MDLSAHITAVPLLSCFLGVSCCCLVVWLFSDPVDYSLPGSSVYGIFQQEHWNRLPLRPSSWPCGSFRSYGCKDGNPQGRRAGKVLGRGARRAGLSLPSTALACLPCSQIGGWPSWTVSRGPLPVDFPEVWLVGDSRRRWAKGGQGGGVGAWRPQPVSSPAPHQSFCLESSPGSRSPVSDSPLQAQSWPWFPHSYPGCFTFRCWFSVTLPAPLSTVCRYALLNDLFRMLLLFAARRLRSVPEGWGQGMGTGDLTHGSSVWQSGQRVLLSCNPEGKDLWARHGVGDWGVVMDGEAFFFKGLFKIFWLKIITPLLKMTVSNNNWGKLLHILQFHWAFYSQMPIKLCLQDQLRGGP